MTPRARQIDNAAPATIAITALSPMVKSASKTLPTPANDTSEVGRPNILVARRRRYARRWAH